MKKLKQLFICLSAFVFCLGLTLATASTVRAASKDVPKKAHVYTGSTASFEFTFDSEGSEITNLKSSSKNLKVKLTHQCKNDCRISFYGKKKGSYKITFTIKPQKGKSINKTVKVTADNVTPFKKITYAGKSVPLYTYENNSVLYTTAASGKLSVTMNKGYKVKKITLHSYKQTTKNGITSSTYMSKTIKNNKKMTLGKPYYYGSGSSFNRSLCSNFGEIEIQYTSPYSTEVLYYYIYVYKL